MERVIQSNLSTYRFKNVMLDEDNNLEEGIDIWEDGKYLGSVLGYIDLENEEGDNLIEIANNL